MGAHGVVEFICVGADGAGAVFGYDLCMTGQNIIAGAGFTVVFVCVEDVYIDVDVNECTDCTSVFDEV